VVAEEGAVAEPFGVASAPAVFNLGDVRVPFFAGFALGGGTGSISMASTSPFTGSSAKAWYLDLAESVDS